MRIPVEPTVAPRWSAFWRGTESAPPTEEAPARWLAVLSFVGFALLAATCAFNFLRDVSWYESYRAPIHGSWLIGIALWGGLSGAVVVMSLGSPRGSWGARRWTLPLQPLVGFLVGTLALAVALIPLASAQMLPPGVDLTLQLLFVTLSLQILAFVSVSTPRHPDPWSQVAFILGLVEGWIGFALAIVFASVLAAPPMIT